MPTRIKKWHDSQDGARSIDPNVKLIHNKDRTGYDRFVYNGYKTEDGNFYVLKEHDGYHDHIHLVTKEDFEKIYDEKGHKIDRVAKYSLASLRQGLSEESARQLLRKFEPPHD